MSKLKVYSPYDGHLIKEVPLCDQKAAMAAMDLAHKTYLDRDNWLPTWDRKAILEKFLQLMKKDKDRLAKESAEEGGKPLIDSQVEAARAIDGTKVAIEYMGQMTGTEIPMRLTPSSAGRMAYTYREPKGVVLSISAFNHPLNLVIHQVIPAIAVGAPVIIKPASTTPISCFNVVELLYKAGLPKEWCQVVACDNEVAEKLACDSRISFLSFIGSSKVGWYLRSNLPPGASCALEHGGAAPVIFEADADVEDALPLLVKGGFYHAGQVCVSVQRIFAHETLAKDVAKKIASKAEKLVVGDPVDDKTEVGPLIAEREVDRVAEWVNEAVKKGATLLCGGKKITDTCYAPTVLLDPPRDANVSQKEMFGPVVCVYSYKDRLKAIDQANSLPFIFQGSVFTKDIDIAIDTVKRLNGTAIMVNDHTAFRVDWMPFGGAGESGLAMGGIPYSMHDMTAEKMMVLRSPAL